MKRGTALRLYRHGEKRVADATRYHLELTAWIESLMSFSPSGRLEIVQALNASRELLDIASPVQLAGLHAILLHAARAVRDRDHAAAHLLRGLPTLALEGTPAHAAFSMVARGARPTLVVGTRSA